MCSCVFVFGCVWLCEHVLVCDRMCCLRCEVMTVQKKNQNGICNYRKNPAREFISITVEN